MTCRSRTVQQVTAALHPPRSAAAHATRQHELERRRLFRSEPWAGPRAPPRRVPGVRARSRSMSQAPFVPVRVASKSDGKRTVPSLFRVSVPQELASRIVHSAPGTGKSDASLATGAADGEVTARRGHPRGPRVLTSPADPGEHRFRQAAARGERCRRGARAPARSRGLRLPPTRARQRAEAGRPRSSGPRR